MQRFDYSLMPEKVRWKFRVFDDSNEVPQTISQKCILVSNERRQTLGVSPIGLPKNAVLEIIDLLQTGVILASA